MVKIKNMEKFQYGQDTKETRKVFFECNGYSLGGKRCFSTYSELEPNKELIMLSDNFIKNQLTKLN
jgi:hypothetical protein